MHARFLAEHGWEKHHNVQSDRVLGLDPGCEDADAPPPTADIVWPQTVRLREDPTPDRVFPTRAVEALAEVSIERVFRRATLRDPRPTAMLRDETVYVEIGKDVAIAPHRCALVAQAEGKHAMLRRAAHAALRLLTANQSQLRTGNLVEALVGEQTVRDAAEHMNDVDDVIRELGTALGAGAP